MTATCDCPTTPVGGRQLRGHRPGCATMLELARRDANAPPYQFHRGDTVNVLPAETWGRVIERWAGDGTDIYRVRHASGTIHNWAEDELALIPKRRR